MKKGIIIFFGILIGILTGYILFQTNPQIKVLTSHRKIIGFLPYWLINKAKNDYSSSISTLAYFSLTANADGHIIIKTNPQEFDPGWLTLHSSKVKKYLKKAMQEGLDLSLTVSSGDQNAIEKMVRNPIQSARNLTHDVIPIMHDYGFSDLNLDIENTRQDASDSAYFTSFLSEIKNNLTSHQTGSLTIELLASTSIKKDLINPIAIAPIADNIVIMTYDFHYIGSRVTGAVAPLYGAGTIAEYDTKTAIQKAIENIPAQKVIMGIPLYGYEWETLLPAQHAAVIPGSGLTSSSKRTEIFLSSCATCSAQFDTTAMEPYTIFHDNETGTYHQIFYPDIRSTAAKSSLAKQYGLGGIALWALGYEDKTILDPLNQYK